jgi:hypothetical protein
MVPDGPAVNHPFEHLAILVEIEDTISSVSVEMGNTSILI